MNVLFMSLSSMENLETDIYKDLLKTFFSHGHQVYAISPRERRTNLPTEYASLDGIQVLRVSVGNITKTNLIEKGISTLTLSRRYLSAFKKYLSDIKFNLIIYCTPPTTLAPVVNWVKKQTGARSYLLLKDIFPQNAVDLDMLSTTGLKGLIYKYFKSTERKTYEAADNIGCTSPANIKYLIEHQPQIDPSIVEENPNSLIVRDMISVSPDDFAKKYMLPADEVIFAYGGNLGVPQDIGFLIDVLSLNEETPVAFFLIAGSGTERGRLEKYFNDHLPKHAKLLPHLPPDEYNSMLVACDVGVVLLNNRFTVPNSPCRILSYMQASLPVITATDPFCDSGLIAEENGFGIACQSDDPEAFLAACRKIASLDLIAMGARSRKYMESHYSTEVTYQKIMRHFNE